jgi:hypothetical protein
MSTSRPLSTKHAEHLAQFRIPPELLEAAGVRSLSNFEAREELGIHGYRGADVAGIFFPYLSPITGNCAGGRIRLDCPLPNGARYISEAGCRHLFFSPFPKEWLTDSSVPVVIVEAEKSCLAVQALADRAGRPMLVIAIGGCWGWRRKIGNRPLPDGGVAPETGPSPDLSLIIWQERQVTLAFDSNAGSNPKVRKARREFARELTARGATVLIGEVPAGQGVNGPDDLIAISGDVALLGVLDNARIFAECAIVEAQRAIADLESNQNGDPLPAIDSIAAVDDAARRALLVGRLVAAKVKGVTRNFIDLQVRQLRAQATAQRAAAIEAVRHNRLLVLGPTIDGAELLESICAFIQRFMLLSRPQLVVIALWVAHTYLLVAADSTPYLAISSPEKRSGKTRLLEILAILVLNPWLTGAVTAAVLYRKIDADAPTLLLDESDAAFNGIKEYAEALRGILDTGHRRGGVVTCCVGQGAEITFKDFSSFSPKAIAGIGKLPDTVTDRAIPIRLKRKTRADKVERFRRRNVEPEAASLREKLAAWCTANIERLRDCPPDLPEALTDRQQDGAEPLLAIADLAAVEWPETARNALVTLCAEPQAADDSIGVRLLNNIYEIFHSNGVARMISVELAAALAQIETSPWGDWKRGKPITPFQLASLLRPFDIAPHNIRFPQGVHKGYETADFDEAATSLQSSADSSSSHFSNRYRDANVAGLKHPKANEKAGCSGVAVSESKGKPIGILEEL